jgi:hypothetical protein
VEGKNSIIENTLLLATLKRIGIGYLLQQQ